MSFQILGTGSFTPERVGGKRRAFNYVETSDEWITKRIGVKQRHVCTTETTADMGGAGSKKGVGKCRCEGGGAGSHYRRHYQRRHHLSGLAGMVQNRIGAHCPRSTSTWPVRVFCSLWIRRQVSLRERQ